MIRKSCLRNEKALILTRQFIRISCFKSFQKVTLKFSYLKAQIIVQHFLQMCKHNHAGQDRVIIRHIRIGKPDTMFQFNFQPLFERLK